VEIQGGRIWLKSVENKGTRFYIEFKKGMWKYGNY
jgi:two-component system OmpR family sensor kinase